VPLGLGIFRNQPTDVVAIKGEAWAKGQRKIVASVPLPRNRRRPSS